MASSMTVRCVPLNTVVNWPLHAVGKFFYCHCIQSMLPNIPGKLCVLPCKSSKNCFRNASEIQQELQIGVSKCLPHTLTEIPQKFASSHLGDVKIFVEHINTLSIS